MKEKLRGCERGQQDTREIGPAIEKIKWVVYIRIINEPSIINLASGNTVDRFLFRSKL